MEEKSLVQVREDGGLNSGDSTSGGVKWTDLGYILKAHPRGADNGLHGEELLLYSFCSLHFNHIVPGILRYQGLCDCCSLSLEPCSFDTGLAHFFY